MRKFRTEDVDVDRLKTILVNSGMQSKEPAAFQTINGLIDASQFFKKGLTGKLGINDPIPLINAEGSLPLKNGGTQFGRYAPVLDLVSNLTGAGVDDLYWTRIGSTVDVGGRFQVTPTAIGVDTELGFELPIISYFDFDYQCTGAAASPTVNQSGAIVGDVGNNRAVLQFLSVTNVTFDMYFTFRYTIIEQ